MIDRLHRLYILDGSPSVYANLAREWERRDMRWCGGVRHEPPMTLAELRDWAKVEFFSMGCGAFIESSPFSDEGVVHLRIIGRVGGPPVAVVWLSADHRPRFRFFSTRIDHSNKEDFCNDTHMVRGTWVGSTANARINMPCCPVTGKQWFEIFYSSRVCFPHSIPSGSCTESC